jgi:hypothetical protein
VERLLRMASGYERIEASAFTGWKTHTHFAHDEQFYMHVDTYQPSWKVFVFPPTALEQGPFHFVFGSHRNTEGRLRWLYERSRGLLNASSMRLNDSSPERARSGPYLDATHGVAGSSRFEGFDPEAGDGPSAASLRSFGFGTPTPIATMQGITLVIADTSGLHYRGFAAAGMQRTSARLAGSGGGCGGCIPRKNPFFCEPLPQEC